MKIQIDRHTLVRAEERGTNEKEICEVLEMGSPISGKYGRLGKTKIYDFKQKRQKNIMNTKKWKCIILLKKESL